MYYKKCSNYIIRNKKDFIFIHFPRPILVSHRAWLHVHQTLLCDELLVPHNKLKHVQIRWCIHELAQVLLRRTEQLIANQHALWRLDVVHVHIRARTDDLSQVCLRRLLKSCNARGVVFRSRFVTRLAAIVVAATLTVNPNIETTVGELAYATLALHCKYSLERRLRLYIALE